MKRWISTKGLPTEEWLRYRRLGIGGSDASTILGLNPYNSILRLWEDKTGRYPVEKAENEKEAQAAEGKVTTQVEETTEEETGKTDTAGTTQTPDTDSNGEYYVVQRGDTLATISQKLYGDTSHIDAIARMNGLTNGDFIYIGQKLLLP